MQLVNVMMMPKRRLIILALLAVPFISMSQENSPYSRYGIGNLVPAGNVVNRAMGGIYSGFADHTSINFLNPASYSNLSLTTFDIGADFASRALKSSTPPATYTSYNAIISYIQIGFPLLNINKKAKKDKSWGVNIGLRPVSRINYKIQKNSRITNIDSLETTYEGSGGLNEAYIGTGLGFKNLSFGFNLGYGFGNKDYGTRLIFINDTIPYLKSNSETKSSYRGLFLEAGVQYFTPIKDGIVRFGAHVRLKGSYNGTQDITRETFAYNATTGNPDRLDSVFDQKGVPGKVTMPASFGLGFTVEKTHLIYGLDFEMTNWNNYRYFGQADAVKNNWMIKAGIQYFPATSTTRKYWDYVKYRAGVYFGPDYIFTTNKNLSQYGITLGGGFPLKIRKTSYYENQVSLLNVALDYGTRGKTTNQIKENIFHVSVGFSLSDLWFVRSKYQ